MYNARNGSKILIDADHPQVHDFKSKVWKTHLNVSFFYAISSNMVFLIVISFFPTNRLLDGIPTLVVSQTKPLTSYSQGQFDDKLFSFVRDVKTIGDMNCLTEVSLRILYWMWYLIHKEYMFNCEREQQIFERPMKTLYYATNEESQCYKMKENGKWKINGSEDT